MKNLRIQKPIWINGENNIILYRGKEYSKSDLLLKIKRYLSEATLEHDIYVLACIYSLIERQKTSLSFLVNINAMNGLSDLTINDIIVLTISFGKIFDNKLSSLLKNISLKEIKEAYSDPDLFIDYLRKHKDIIL